MTTVPDTPAEIARRFARSRTGYELVSFREIALPLFRVECSAIALERKVLSPIDEFVLRGMLAGLREESELAGLLGLDEQAIQRAIASLVHSDCLVLAGGEGTREHLFKVSRKGETAARDAALIQPEEVTLPVWVDGLTRQVLSVNGKGLRRFKPGVARANGLIEIAPSPRRNPDLTEVPFDIVQEVLGRERAGRRNSREIIGITGIGKVQRFVREGVALAFHAESENDPIVSIVVDGELSEAHDAAYARSRERSALPIAPGKWRSAEEELGDDVGPELLGQAAASAEVEQLEDERGEIQEEAAQLRDAAAQAPRSEVEELRKKLVDVEAREAKLLAAVEQISVRQVEVYEHRTYLRRALEEAQERVMIISPWIRFEVVDAAFIEELRQVLERGVELWIGHGISKTPEYRRGKKGERDEAAEKGMERLAGSYEKFTFTRLGDTHAKVLVCDSRFSIITSFNWLSFRGDTSLDFRDERGYYVGLSDHVDRVFDGYRARIEEGAKQTDTPT